MNEIICNIMIQLEQWMDFKLNQIRQQVISKQWQLLEDFKTHTQMATIQIKFQNVDQIIEKHENLIQSIMKQLNISPSSEQPKAIRTKHSMSQSVCISKVLEQKCSLCQDYLSEGQIITTQCGHQYHDVCLQKKVIVQIQNMGFPNGVCVAKTNNHLCYGKITLKECGLHDNKKLYNMQLVNQLQKLSVKCSKCPNCPFIFIINQELPSKFVCPQCCLQFCLGCCQKSESTHNCSEKPISRLFGGLCGQCKTFNGVLKQQHEVECKQCNNKIILM